MTPTRSESYIKFSYYHEGVSCETVCSPETKLDYEIDAEIGIIEICQSFENFLLACGFRLNSNERIGIIESHD